MTDFLRTLPSASLIAIIIALAFGFKLIGQALGWLISEAWSNRKVHMAKHDLALELNTSAIIKLQVQIEQLTELLTLVPKLKADVDYAHLKIRDLQNGLRENAP